MAFPTIVTSAESIDGTNQTDHVVDLPSGIVSGDLLVAYVAFDGNDSIAWPGGWNEIFDAKNSTNNGIAVAWRDADGLEDATITVTTPTSEQTAHVVYRISGAEAGATQVPEITSGATGNSANPDSTSLPPTGGAKDYLWTSAFGIDSNRTVSTYPTNYTLGQHDIVSSDSGANATSIGTSSRNLNAASEDPGQYVVSSLDYWIAVTVAVHPTIADTNIIIPVA